MTTEKEKFNSLEEEWSTNYDKAGETNSPTLTASMEASYKGVADIEKYLEEHGEDITPEERAFLESSVKMKLQNEESRKSDTETASALKEDIVSSISPQEELPENEDLAESIKGLKQGMEFLGIDPETKLCIDTENSDMWKRKYKFTDKKASRFGFMGFLLGNGTNRAEFYEMLGDTASENGIDMNQDRSVAEIMDLLEKKAA